MPTIYRSMRRDGDIPLLGDSSSGLGVRCPGDVTLDDAGLAGPGRGGLSVGRNWRNLPHFLIPLRLQHLVDGATGSDQKHCWRHGNGEFRSGEVAPNLTLRVSSSTKGLVEPSAPVSLSDFKSAVSATRPDWTIDEE